MRRVSQVDPGVSWDVLSQRMVRLAGTCLIVIPTRQGHEGSQAAWRSPRQETGRSRAGRDGKQSSDKCLSVVRVVDSWGPPR